IVDDRAFRFAAVVSQDDASRLFDGNIRRAEVRLFGQGGKSLSVRDYTFIPYQHEKLPSAALGWYGGGDVPVSEKDESGLSAIEPFFQVYAGLASHEGRGFFHGRSGQILFSLRPEPLLEQWERKIRQILQKRYQI
ncbi:MAG: hypothetical protein JSU90_11885, partial [Nitrospiraceae bacterium]